LSRCRPHGGNKSLPPAAKAMAVLLFLLRPRHLKASWPHSGGTRAVSWSRVRRSRNVRYATTSSHLLERAVVVQAPFGAVRRHRGRKPAGCRRL